MQLKAAMTSVWLPVNSRILKRKQAGHARQNARVVPNQNRKDKFLHLLFPPQFAMMLMMSPPAGIMGRTRSSRSTTHSMMDGPLCASAF